MPRITLAIAAVLAVTLPAVSANAQGAIRTFVSTTGSDSNPCSITQPCRHFSAAVAATAVGGEVDALEAGAYGSFAISHAITIEGEGWSYVAPPNNESAITINAGSGNVTIRGVSLNGVGATGTTNGIAFTSGGSLTVTNCVVSNFSGNGIQIAPAGGQNNNLLIVNSFVLNNAGNGIEIDPLNGSNVIFTIDRTTVSNNGTSGTNAGILFNAGAGFSSGTLTSVDADMNFAGVNVINDGFASAVFIRNSIIAHSSSGFDLADTSSGDTVYLSDANEIETLSNSGIIYSDGTNFIPNLLGTMLNSLPRR